MTPDMAQSPFVILFRFARGLTARELAAALGWSESTVRRHARGWLAQGLVRKVGARFELTVRGVILCTASVCLVGYVPPVLRAARAA